MASGKLTYRARPVNGLQVQTMLEKVLTKLQRNNERSYEYEIRYTAEERLEAEINAEIVVNGEAYYREHFHQLGFVNTWNVRDQHMCQVR